MPTAITLDAGAGGTRYDRADNFLRFAPCDGKNCATAQFVPHLFPGAAVLNSTGNTIETNRAHPAR